MIATYEERLNTLNTRINAIIANQNKAGEISTMAKSNNTFFDSYDKLLLNLNSWRLAVKHFDLHLQDNDKALLKDCLNMAKDNYSSKSVKLAESFKGKVSRLCSNMANAWNLFSETMENETVDKLTILRVIANDKRTINNILIAFSEVKNWPLTEQTVQNFLNSKEKAANILESMHFDKAIEDFLRKVSNHEATFLDLNDEIIEWIRKEGLERNISINIK